MTRRTRGPRWRCLVDGCRAWGYADPGEDLAQLQHQHYLEHHYQPTEDK